MYVGVQQQVFEQQTFLSYWKEAVLLADAQTGSSICNRQGILEWYNDQHGRMKSAQDMSATWKRVRSNPPSAAEQAARERQYPSPDRRSPERVRGSPEPKARGSLEPRARGSLEPEAAPLKGKDGD